MNIAELFVNLGIKGTDKTIGALANTQKGLKDVASTSLEAKVAIVGAMYALEQLFAASGQRGTDLTNFNAELGVSTKTLQQYQFAARQAGVSNTAVEGTFKSLQAAMTRTLMGEAPPAGLAKVALKLGDISKEDIARFQKNPELLIQTLQRYAQAEKNIGLRNETLKSFGLGDDMIAAMSRGAFNQGALNKAPTYSDKEIAKLDQANIAWSNLGQTIEMAIGKFNAAHGGQLVNDITMLVPKVIELANSFVRLSEKMHLFELIGKSFEGWGIIFDKINHTIDALTKNDKLASLVTEGTQVANRLVSGTETVVSTTGDLITGGVKGDKAQKDISENLKGFFAVLAEAWKESANSGVQDPALKAMLERQNVANGNPNVSNVIQMPRAITPNAPATPSPGAPAQTINIDQNLNFQHDGKDHQKTSNDMKRAVKDAFRQMPAQAQGT